MFKESWNQVFNFIMKIKYDYLKTFGSFNTYDFETWLEKLNKNEYNDFFSCLQTSQRDYELLIRYGIAEMQEGMWSDPNSLYRECRSIVIDLYCDEIIVAPFRKFFNLDEVQENKLENVQKEIASAKVIEYTNKLDGSMQVARWYNNQIKMYGSMALRKEESWRLADGYNKLTNNHKRMIKDNPLKTIMIFKIGLIPFFLINFLFWFSMIGILLNPMMGFIGVFLIPIAVISTYLTMLITSIYGISIISVMGRKNILTWGQCVIHIIFQLIFILDVADLIFLFVKYRKVNGI
jgi:hypothetical protein